MEQHNPSAKEPMKLYRHVLCGGESIPLRSFCLNSAIELPAEWRYAMRELRRLNARPAIKVESVRDVMRLIYDIDSSVIDEGDQFDQAVDRVGRCLLIAWLKRDARFFEELARLANIELSSKPKRNEGLLSARVIELAVVLFAGRLRNPTQQELEFSCRMWGVKPSTDWGQFLGRCRLEFLKPRPRGRPLKAKIPTSEKIR